MVKTDDICVEVLMLVFDCACATVKVECGLKVYNQLLLKT